MSADGLARLDSPASSTASIRINFDTPRTTYGSPPAAANAG